MSVPFVDTDVIIRLLTGDDVAKQRAAGALFTRVESQAASLQAPDTVIADAVFVLTSPRLYALSRSDVRDLLAPLVQLPHFRVQNRSEILDALDLFAATRLDFSDAMLVSSMRSAGVATLYSFDRDFDRVPGLDRGEP